jgi:Domain of unknown function (DUF4386)
VSATKDQARRAGLLYFLGALVGPFSLVYVPRALIVPGDAAATADHVRTSATLLRMGIAGELAESVLFIFAALALYRLFKGVSETQAAAMATLILISIPVSLLNLLNEVAALMLASGGAWLSVFAKSQLDALVLLCLRLHSQGLFVAEVFWGLWLFPLAILVIRSGFIPRVLGVLLLIAGAGYLASAVTSLVLPRFAPFVARFAVMLEAGELPIVFWLLIWGAKEQPARR